MWRSNGDDLVSVRRDAVSIGGRTEHAGGARGPLPRDGRSTLRTPRPRTALGTLAPGGTDEGASLVRGGGECAPGAGRSNGCAERAPRRRVRDERPSFDRAIKPGGYQWFYLDATSDDGRSSIVVIALLGNPFSPAYARARSSRARSSEGERARALSFCAMNVAVYGPGRSFWALTERAIEDNSRGRSGVQIGASTMERVGDDLVVDIRERTSPFGRPLRGRVVLKPTAETRGGYALDASGEHAWWPIAPSARAFVELDEPFLRFSGCGYHDANAGDVPLEASFSRWSWSRAGIEPGRTIIHYDVRSKAGERRVHALDLDRHGDARDVTNLHVASLPTTAWALDREAVTESISPRDCALPTVVRELEDTPFYARALVRSQLAGRRAVSMHETLSVERLERAWARFLLGFRMGRG